MLKLSQVLKFDILLLNVLIGIVILSVNGSYNEWKVIEMRHLKYNLSCIEFGTLLIAMFEFVK